MSRLAKKKGCLGAVDGTYIDVHVPTTDKARYRIRKGQISTNVLDVCDQDMRLIYVLPGWEGSAADSRVLRDAVNMTHGLKVPKGQQWEMWGNSFWRRSKEGSRSYISTIPREDGPILGVEFAELPLAAFGAPTGIMGMPALEDMKVPITMIGKGLAVNINPKPS